MKNITFWENKKRRSELGNYKNQLEKYFNVADFDEFSREFVDNENSVVLRQYLNKKNGYIEKVMRDAGISPVVFYSPPPAIGGYAANINTLDNLFQLFRFDIPIQHVEDNLDRAIGEYERDFPSAVLRTINPFFWVGKIIDVFATIPFYIFAGMGYDQHKLEKSTWGKTLKGLLKIVGFLLTFAATIDGVWALLASLKFLPSEYSYTKILQFIQHLR